MKNLQLPVPIYEIAFLQAYLYQIYTLESNCKKDFGNTLWYLNEKYTYEEVNSIMTYFKSHGFECDCDIINKLDLKIISKVIIKKHD